MLFEFFSDVCIKVACIDLDFIGGVVIPFGQHVEEFFNLPFNRAYVHASDVDWASYER